MLFCACALFFLDFIFFNLRGAKRGVDSIHGHQLLVRADLLDALVGDHGDAVGVLNGGQTVGNNHGGVVLDVSQAVERLLHNLRHDPSGDEKKLGFREGIRGIWGVLQVAHIIHPSSGMISRDVKGCRSIRCGATSRVRVGLEA